MKRPQEDRSCGDLFIVHRRAYVDGKLAFVPGQRIRRTEAFAAGLIDANGDPIGEPDGPPTYEPPVLPLSGADFAGGLANGQKPLPATGAGW